jgi:DNA uptake protein ComE-like DNA-binding protein
MRIAEGQRLGIIAFLIASLIVYGASHFYHQRPSPQFFLPWGDLLVGTMVVEISGHQGSDGVYFLPKNMSLSMMRRVTGIEGEFISPLSDALRINDLLAAAISRDGGVLRVGDMRAAARLALGIPIDINIASAEEISLVPGIGQKLGAEIFQFRLSRGKIESLSELTAVPGIKEKKLNSLRKYLTAGLSEAEGINLRLWITDSE